MGEIGEMKFHGACRVVPRFDRSGDFQALALIFKAAGVAL
jgi:hypothetical protein